MSTNHGQQHILSAEVHPTRPDLHRIIAGRDLPRQGVSAGDVGGWVQSLDSVSGDARVSGDAWVSGDARVYGDARVSGDARVYGDARVSGNADLLALAGLPSGHATMYRTTTGHTLHVGCWTGTTAALRGLVSSDDGWPEARGTEVATRRPGLLALADLCDAQIATWSAHIDG